MKTKSKCIGCGSIKLVNSMGLCKRCNRHAHEFISKDEMIRLKLEREMMQATKGAKKAKKTDEAEGEKKEGEEGEEGGEEGSEEENEDSN